MTTLTPPRANIPIGWVTVNGQKVPAAIDPEWLRYLANSLFDRGGGTIGSGTDDLETAAFDDAGIDDLKARVSQLADEMQAASIAAEIGALRSRMDALEQALPPEDVAGKTWLQKAGHSGGTFTDQGPAEGDLAIRAAVGTAAGRSLTLAAGAGGTGAAGTTRLLGAVSTSGAAGPVVITGGEGNSTTTAGAVVQITGGQAAGAINAVGGNVELTGGLGGNGGRGGHVVIRPGTSSTGSVFGDIHLDGGRGAALGTAATRGFVTVPTCPGTPSGVPSTVPTGSVASVFDSTNLKDYRYTGGNWRFADFGVRATKGTDTTDDLIVDLATKGLVLKDTAGTPHYWRVTVSTLGALTVTDLGTTKP